MVGQMIDRTNDGRTNDGRTNDSAPDIRTNIWTYGGRTKYCVEVASTSAPAKR